MTALRNIESKSNTYKRDNRRVSATSVSAGIIDSRWGVPAPDEIVEGVA